ncbi:MAG: hypothetical protein KN64_12920 [Sulfurovum sp. AS07-7]|nr:MAG: hypothetical protein KN64_12920 [Sulfurovum sp. AS07-7]
MNKIYLSTLALILSSSFAMAGVEKFIIPAIDDTLIFENSTISTYQTNIDTKVAQNETKTLSFVLKSTSNLSNLTLEIPNLTGTNGTINATSLDVKIVKSWYQNDNVNFNDSSKKILTPELLLKDESGIKVENGTNFLKDTSGNWIDISQNKSEKLIKDPLFKDSDSLKSFSLGKDINKQFFITLKVPQNTKAGTYTGKIKVKSNASTLAQIDVKVEVMPFLLEKSLLTHKIYYDGRYAPNGQSEAYQKTKAEIQGEFKNLVSHFTNPIIPQEIADENLFREYLKLRKEAGFDTLEPLFIQNGYNIWFKESTSNRVNEIEKLKANVQKIITIAREEGFSGDVYIYGVDEPTLDKLTNQRELWSAIHEVGGKVFCALSIDDKHLSLNDVKAMADILDLGILSSKPDKFIADEFHKYGNKVGSYANPQAGRITPLTYRKNYGLKLWQQDYDLATTWAYQGHLGTTWNVFDYAIDSNSKKIGYDEVFTYPTVNGAIDTIEWEGWRESVTDSMYLATLLTTIEKAKTKNIDITNAQNFIDELKIKDLDSEDFESIREDITTQILSLNTQINQNSSPQEEESGIFDTISKALGF